MSERDRKLYESGQALLPVVNEFAAVETIFHHGDDLIFKVTPHIPPDIWQETLRRQAFELGYHLAFFPGEGTLLIVAKDIRPAKRKIPWLNIVLFAATVLSVVSVYAYYEHGDAIFRNFKLLGEGLQFASALMPILLCHEFGHYIAARRHRADVSLPYFIPAPTIIGTLGAIIKSRTPFRNRRQLFDVGAAGPLAGIIPSLVVLGLGLHNARVADTIVNPSPPVSLYFGESVLFTLVRWISLGSLGAGKEILLSPLIMAGWVGLFVTMLNLMPLGQLDGGHILYAMFGGKVQERLAQAFFLVLVVLGFWWPGWFLWALLTALLIKLRHPPTLDDSERLDRTRMILGWAAILIFLVTFMPVPLGVTSH